MFSALLSAWSRKSRPIELPHSQTPGPDNCLVWNHVNETSRRTEKSYLDVHEGIDLAGGGREDEVEGVLVIDKQRTY